MTKEQASALLRKYQSGECTPEEKIFLDHWYLSAAAKQALPESLPDLLSEEQFIWSRIQEELPGKHNIRYLKIWYAVAAASVLVFLSFGIFFYLTPKTTKHEVAQHQINKNDIRPGGNKAILTLAGGQKVILNATKIGTIAKQGRVSISKTASGEIAYNGSAGQPDGSQLASNTSFNTITTPKGGQYQVILPDGSVVLLNAGSSLTYPIFFTGIERKVELTGEAYFEVTHNPAMPFRVYSKGQVVEVLGTHFNVNAYDDEPGIKTTLLQGKVKVTAITKKQTLILQPGEQAFLGITGFNEYVVDTDEAVAWKNGLFIFDDNDIHEIMRSISRWYDVDVIYKGTAPTDLFSGSVSKFSNVSEVLNLLQLTRKVHFSIEGKNITVYK